AFRGGSGPFARSPLVDALGAGRAADGRPKSRIIVEMTSHSSVTTTRHLTGVAVTEFHLADLRGLTATEGAQSPIGVVHPLLRDELAVAVESLGL
ncbi:MAG TPA: acetyl-CoA hydrolase/transferase C-terminal domain-containing protein, partial [Acidimicrobiales bacterium]